MIPCQNNNSSMPITEIWSLQIVKKRHMTQLLYTFFLACATLPILNVCLGGGFILNATTLTVTSYTYTVWYGSWLVIWFNGKLKLFMWYHIYLYSHRYDLFWRLKCTAAVISLSTLPIMCTGAEISCGTVHWGWNWPRYRTQFWPPKQMIPMTVLSQ